MSAANNCGATLASSLTKLESNFGPEVAELIPCVGSLVDVGSIMLPSTDFFSDLDIPPVVLLCSGATRLREELSRLDDLLVESILLFFNCTKSTLLLMPVGSILLVFSVGSWTGKSSEEGKTISWPFENSIDRPVPSEVFGCSGITG